MTTKRYIEVTSSHRDRNAYPNQSSFNVLFSQNGSVVNNAITSLDPIYDSVPLYIFKTNQNSKYAIPSVCSVESISQDLLKVQLGAHESSKKDFLNGYKLILLYSDNVHSYVYDRTIKKYENNVAIINRPLPKGLMASSSLKYHLIDTNFTSTISFTNLQPFTTNVNVQKNNIRINVDSSLNGCFAFFDDCFFSITDVNQPHIVNNRKIVSTEYDSTFPNQLILYFDTELSFVPPQNKECTITNFNKNLNNYPSLHIQSVNIYGNDEKKCGLDNYYNGYVIENIQTREFRKIMSFSYMDHTIQIDSPFSDSTSSLTYCTFNTIYTIRRSLPIDYFYMFSQQKISPLVGAYNIRNLTDEYEVHPSLPVLNNVLSDNAYISSFCLLLDQNSVMTNGFYDGLYIRINQVNSSNYNMIFKIKKYYPYVTIYDRSNPRNINKIITQQKLCLALIEIPSYSSFVPVTAGDTYEILNFSRDNFNPISYSGNVTSQQEAVAHEVELLNLIIPNVPLKNSHSIGTHPYFYVIFQTHSVNNKNVICSNNENANKAVFIVKSSKEDHHKNFCYLSISGMVQTIKFKPNENLVFGIYLPNGQPLEFLEQDDFSPFPPKDYLQISGVFSMKRLS